jgi:hypothetical protein
MQALRKNPILAVVLLVAAILLLAASLYLTFVKQASPASPFSDLVPNSSPEPTPPASTNDGGSAGTVL